MNNKNYGGLKINPCERIEYYVEFGNLDTQKDYVLFCDFYTWCDVRKWLIENCSLIKTKINTYKKERLIKLTLVAFLDENMINELLKVYAGINQ